MQIDSLNRVPVAAPDPNPKSQEEIETVRGIVAGIRAINKAESLGTDRELAFQFDQESGRVLIQIKDRTTGEVLRQIPLKELLEMMKNLQLQRRQKANQ